MGKIYTTARGKKCYVSFAIATLYNIHIFYGLQRVVFPQWHGIAVFVTNFLHLFLYKFN